MVWREPQNYFNCYFYNVIVKGYDKKTNDLSIVFAIKQFFIVKKIPVSVFTAVPDLD